MVEAVMFSVLPGSALIPPTAPPWLVETVASTTSTGPDPPA